MIALFGDGTLDMSVPSRDGSICDRAELLKGFEELGHDWVYLAPQVKSPGNPRVVGWAWRGRADFLVIEARRSVFFHGGNFERNPAFNQWKVLADWAAGKFGDAKLRVIDFDMNIREVFGLGSRKGDLWHNVPGAVDAASLIRDEAVFLTPCEPAALDTGSADVRRWLWPYPAGVEVPLDELSFSGRKWQLGYGGSDYDRRGSFTRFYVEAARQGWRTGVTGSWNDTRKGGRRGDDRSLCVKGFKSRCESEGVLFLGVLPYRQFFSDFLRQASATVQVVPAQYEKAGYYTIRMAEAAAAGCIPFIDRSIQFHESIVPDEWYRVSSFQELSAKVSEAHGREKDHVVRWRDHLHSLGTGASQAQLIIG